MHGLMAQAYAGPSGHRPYGKYWAYIHPTVDAVFQYAPCYGSILHGGGHIGLMSLALATRFQHVHVFEVADDNFGWLQTNVAHEPRITATYGALGDGKPVGLVRGKYSATHHARGPGTVPCFRIDDLALPTLDVLMLDLEGGEMLALQHAQETLRRCQPLLVIEEWSRWMKRYGYQPGDIARFLAPRGYQQVTTTPFDVVYHYKGAC